MVRAMHVAREVEYCDFRGPRGARCHAKRGEDWSPCDQALWLSSLMIARNAESEDWDYEAYLFFGLWIRSLLEGR